MVHIQHPHVEMGAGDQLEFVAADVEDAETLSAFLVASIDYLRGAKFASAPASIVWHHILSGTPAP